MHRINFNEIIDLVEDINSLMDKHGEINKGNPLYSHLKDMIFYNLMSDEAQEAVGEYIRGQHSNYEDVGLNCKQMFDVLRENKHIEVDPEESFFSGLLDEDEYETYSGMKKNPVYKDWNAKRFYELYSEMKDRDDKPQRLLLAKLFKAMINDDTPVKEKPKGFSFKGGKYQRG